MSGAPTTAWHHLLAKGVFEPANKKSLLNELGLRLDKGVDIHAKEWGWEIRSDKHAKLHSNQNVAEERWEQYEKEWLTKKASEGAFKDNVVKKSDLRQLKRDVIKDFELAKDGMGKQSTREYPRVIEHLRKLGKNLDLPKLQETNPERFALVKQSLKNSRRGFVAVEMLGKLSTGVAAVMDGYEIVRSDHPMQTALEKGGAWANMLIGAEVGAAFGGPIGAIVGGTVGYIGGEKAVHEIVPIAKLAEQTKDMRDFNDRHNIQNPVDDRRGEIMSPAAAVVEMGIVADRAGRLMQGQDPDQRPDWPP